MVQYDNSEESSLAGTHSLRIIALYKNKKELFVLKEKILLVIWIEFQKSCLPQGFTDTYIKWASEYPTEVETHETNSSFFVRMVLNTCRSISFAVRTQGWINLPYRILEEYSETSYKPEVSTFMVDDRKLYSEGLNVGSPITVNKKPCRLVPGYFNDHYKIIME